MLSIVKRLREVEAAIDTGFLMPHDPAEVLREAADRLDAVRGECHAARRQYAAWDYLDIPRLLDRIEKAIGIEPLTPEQKVERVQALIDECRNFAVREGETPVVSMDALIEALNG